MQLIFRSQRPLLRDGAITTGCSVGVGKPKHEDALVQRVIVLENALQADDVAQRLTFKAGTVRLEAQCQRSPFRAGGQRQIIARRATGRIW